MPSGIDLARDRMGHATSQGPAGCGLYLLTLSYDRQPAGIDRTNLPDRAPNKYRPAQSHSKVQLPCSNVLPQHFATSPLRRSSRQLGCFDNLPHSSALHAKIAPLFSQTYELLFPQMLSFDNLTNCRGVYPPRRGFSLPRNPQVILFQYLPHYFRTLLRSRKDQPSCFHCFVHSFTKTPGVGGAIMNFLRMNSPQVKNGDLT